ncbi:MAG: DotU family type IV/VI secretion system protein [Nibricoccus sp.]
MTLIELCEPLFNYVCRLNRLARSGQPTDFDIVRTEIRELMTKAAEASRDNPGLAEQYKKVELSLIFFIDSVIAESSLPFAANWNQRRLAYERNELAGDEKFFDIIDETLAQQGPEADERLAVYYTCIGLGFTGWYQLQPEYLRKKMRQIAQRITSYIEPDEQSLVTPDSYQHTDTTNLPLPVSESLTPLVLVIVGLVVLVGGLNFYLFKRSSSDIQQALTTIVEHDQVRKGASTHR